MYLARHESSAPSSCGFGVRSKLHIVKNRSATFFIVIIFKYLYFSTPYYSESHRNLYSWKIRDFHGVTTHFINHFSSSGGHFKYSYSQFASVALQHFLKENFRSLSPLTIGFSKTVCTSSCNACFRTLCLGVLSQPFLPTEMLFRTDLNTKTLNVA